MTREMYEYYCQKCKWSKYTASFEIEGEFAHFRDPISGRANNTYPVPTWSALKGIVENFAKKNGSFLFPVHCQICRPIQTMEMTRNYNGNLGKQNKDVTIQNRITVLTNICYKVMVKSVYDVLYDEIVSRQHAYEMRHYLLEQFKKRLRRGENKFGPVSLGLKEFTVSYCGPVRPETTPCDVNFVIPKLLFNSFRFPVYNPTCKELYDKLENHTFSWPENAAHSCYLDNVKVVNGTYSFVDQDFTCPGKEVKDAC